MRPSLDALATFDAVARHGSFTRAAGELHVTQSAVSHRVADLEAQLGVALLLRTSRNVELTEAGALLAPGLARGLEAIDDALTAIRRRERTLSVSCSPSFAIRWLVRALPRFRAGHPEVRVVIAAEDRLAMPGAGGVDVCVRFGAGHYPGVTVERLTEEETFPVVSPALVSQRPLRRLAQLGGHVLLHHDVLRDHPGHIDWRRYLGDHLRGIDPDEGPRFSHAHLALEAALAGQGVALGRRTLVAEDLAAGRLVAPLRRRVSTELAYWLLTPRTATEEARRFGRWLRDELSS